MKKSNLIQWAILLFLAMGCSQDQKKITMETQRDSAEVKTSLATSRDGTTIGYEKTGTGPGVILVNGALAHRELYGEKDLAERLAKNFTVIFYDRRGRGESADTKPYSVEKEIDDIEALIDEAGGSAYLYGSSGGAALALLAAEKLGPEKVTKLALYEPPYGSGTKQEFSDEKNKIGELVKSGNQADAVAFFFEKRGTPPDKIEVMKKSPEWKDLVRIGHTLVYDFAVLGDGTIPVDVAKNIAIPTLVIAGEKSFDFVHVTADTLKKVIPRAAGKTLKDQTHFASPEAVAPVLMDFFGTQSK